MSKKRLVIRIIEAVAILLLIITLAVVLLPAVQRAQETKRQALCQDILRQWGQAYAMYAGESPGNLYPPMHIVNRHSPLFPESPDCLEIVAGPQLETIYPDYIQTLGMIVCPSDPEARAHELLSTGQDDTVANNRFYIGNLSYFYLGWLFDQLENGPARNLNEFSHLSEMNSGRPPPILEGDAYITAQFAAGVEALFQAVKESNLEAIPGVRFPEITDNPLKVSSPYGNNSGDMLHRLGTGVERFMITDVNDKNVAASAQTRIWVMMDIYASSSGLIYFNHLPGGSNVLYADGSVRFVRYVQGPSGPGIDRGAEAPVMPGMGLILDMFIRMRRESYTQIFLNAVNTDS